MASSAKKHRGRHESTSRGIGRYSRGGALRSGKTGGKGSGTVWDQNPFCSTRIEEQPQEGENEGSEQLSSNAGHERSFNDSDVSSDSGEDDLSSTGVQPYNSLLQSLSTSIPQHKRRKIDHLENQISANVVLEDLDEITEPEVIEDVEADGDEALEEIDEGNDPFRKHFSDQDAASLAQSIKERMEWPLMGSRSPGTTGWTIREEGRIIGSVPPMGGKTAIKGIEDLHLKKKLIALGIKLLPELNDVEASLAYAFFNYKGVLFPQRTVTNADVLRKLFCLHALNHIFKTRDHIIKNNARLARNNGGEDLELRDQGFTRPKVLVILPTRNSCAKYVETIVSLCEPEQQENKKRFQDSYVNSEDILSDDKGADFRELFAGNDDDMFRLGMKFTRKTVKYFSQFYNSDIIFASPLGLRMACSADDPKKKDHDFLSSIEVVLVDQADAIAMQNWEHVEYIFEHLNLQPKETHGCDFSRVRHYHLDNLTRYLRQTILLSAFNFPTLNKIHRRSLNVAGKIKYDKDTEGAMVDIGISCRQKFCRLKYTTPASEPDERFKYFSTAILPSLSRNARSRSGSGQGTLIFIPWYADFVRVRNFLASSPDTQDISFGLISEYTPVQEVARARSHFVSGKHSVLLYTERAHHFRRYRLRGVKQVIMYALPENPMFYKDVAGGFLQSSVAGSTITAREVCIKVLFSTLDVIKLERIVGTRRHNSMLASGGGDIFAFE